VFVSKTYIYRLSRKISSPDSARISSRDGKSFTQVPAREKTSSAQGIGESTVCLLVRAQMLSTDEFSESENFASLVFGKGFGDRINLFSDGHNLVIGKVQIQLYKTNLLPAQC
jgi:hypothetical protein